MQWYYWAIILGFLVIMYVFLLARQKKQEKQSRELLDTFKVGDKVVTHIGVYGKIKRIYNTTYGKVCVLEVGTLDKVDIEIDMRYIAGIDEKTLVPDEPKVQEVRPEENNSEKTEEPVKEELNREKPKQKKSTNKAKSKK